MTLKHSHNPLSRVEACATLNVTARTLRRYVRDGKVRMVKISGKFFYFVNPDNGDTADSGSSVSDDNADSGQILEDSEDRGSVQQGAKGKSGLVLLSSKVGSKEDPRTKRVSAGNAAVAIAAEAVPVVVHQMALEQIARLVAAVERLSAESADHRHTAERLREQAAELNEILEEVADREQDRRRLCEELAKIPRWKWRKRSKIQEEIASK